MAQAKKFEANYDESKVGEVNLPPLWDKAPPTDPAALKQAWQVRRAEILKLLADQMFGHAPSATAAKLSWKVVEEGEAFAGAAHRKQIRVTLTTNAGELPIDLLLYAPAKKTTRSTTFLGLNFRGNHGETKDPAVLLPSSWVTDSKDGSSENNRATEKGRGAQAHRLPVELIVQSGCAVATAYYGDIDPDFDDGFQNGIHRLFPDHVSNEQHPDRWGSIASWAWGLSRLLDVLLEQPEVDGQRVIVFGHSRLGKTSLWAGATDTRFAGAISNDSGCGGAALNRRIFGETVGRINTSFPHWFCRNFRQYNENEQQMPFDQHHLLALIAPRLLHVASATEDLWADPRGEYLATLAASPVFEQLGTGGLTMKEFPGPDGASIGQVSYHLRSGKHDLTSADWEQYLKSAKLLK
ncbi:MAG: acetylxylan esterase [Pirellulaceae bacterium]|nr:acetylxylan esterase [Pirellulaceae bacterium]